MGFFLSFFLSFFLFLFLLFRKGEQNKKGARFISRQIRSRFLTIQSPTNRPLMEG